MIQYLEGKHFKVSCHKSCLILYKKEKPFNRVICVVDQDKMLKVAKRVLYETDFQMFLKQQFDTL